MTPAELIPSRVRLVRGTRKPVDSPSKVASEMDPATQEMRPNFWTAKGKWETHQVPQRGGHREVPAVDAEKGKSPVNLSSWPPRLREWKSEKCSYAGAFLFLLLCAQV